MIQRLEIENRTVTICSPQNITAALPLVLLNTVQDEGPAVFDKCREIGCCDFLLAALSDIGWNSDLTPWYVPRSGKGSAEYPGQADAYIRTITDAILPEVRTYIEKELKTGIRCYALAGYSLAGLFALYCAYRTDQFTKIASASGSFWFPGFAEFAKENVISPHVEKIYFSLGEKESRAKNRIFASVGENTLALEKLYRSQGIETIYEENPGNHFQDPVLRMARGIRWILK